MTLKIPVNTSATELPDWVRKCANAVNDMGNSIAGFVGRLTALETFRTAATSDITALEASDVALDSRVDALETFAAAPFTVASITLPPAALPASPVHGMLATDIADGKLKYYDGTVWQTLY